ncbi:MAG TPA: hypothetical protein VG900_07250 [Hyphomicrobiaceae bacterium]|jgi:hypothetical protein|nr:hypothetical protein [Hyphomicrobiaceae bacterium]
MRAVRPLLCLVLAGAVPSAPALAAEGVALGATILPSLLVPAVVLVLALAIAIAFEALSYDPEKAFIGGGVLVAAWAYLIRDARAWHAVLIGFEAMAALGLLFSLYALARGRRDPGEVGWFFALVVVGAAALAYVRPRGLF